HIDCALYMPLLVEIVGHRIDYQSLPLPVILHCCNCADRRRRVGTHGEKRDFVWIGDVERCRQKNTYADDKGKVVPCHPGGLGYLIGPLLDHFLGSQEPTAYLPHEFLRKIRVIAQEALKLLPREHNEVGFLNTYCTSHMRLVRQKSHLS